MSKHTPTPWEATHHICGIQIRGNDEGCIVAEMIEHIYDERKEPEEMEANAKHIVKCVNSHNDLVGLLDEILDVNSCGEFEFRHPFLHKRIKQAIQQAEE